MPPVARAAPATDKVRATLEDNIALIERRLKEKDAHRFHDLTKLTEQRFKFICELERVTKALGEERDHAAEQEALNRRISELEYQLGIYKAKYGDLFRKNSVDEAAPDDPEPFGAGDDPV